MKQPRKPSVVVPLHGEEAPMVQPNGLHPVDELGQLREVLNPLKKRDRHLRAMIASGNVSLLGRSYEGYITTKEIEGYDVAAIVAYYGERELARFRVRRTLVKVEAKRRNEPR